MANTAKVFIDGDGYLFETNGGNFTLTNNGMSLTTRTGNNLTEAQWDINVQAMLDNAITHQSQFVSVDFMKAFMITVNEKMEDFD
jgi:hypothetical protein